MGSGTWWKTATGRTLLLFGVAYTSVWWSYQRFYAPFGVAPQDVGLVPNGGLSDIIGAVVRLGLWLALALVVLAALPAVAVWAIGYAIEIAEPWRKGTGPVDWCRCTLRRCAPQWLQVTIALAVGLVAATGAVLVYLWLLGRWFALAAGLLLIVSVLVWSEILKATARPPAEGEPPPYLSRLQSWTAARVPWGFRVFNLFAVLAVIGLFFFDLPADAATAARCAVQPGQEAVRGIGAPWSGAHLVLLDVQAQPAMVHWISGTGPASSPATFPAVYLGTANGWVVVYRKLSPRPVVDRLPAGDVTISIDANSPTCKAAH